MPTVLIHLSGGLDSTYVLYKHLQENPNKTVLVHHVNLHHPAEDRLETENKAVHQILDWMKNNVSSNFVYHESTFGYGSLPRIAIKDIQIISLFSAIILRTANFSRIKEIKFGWHQGEVSNNDALRGLRVSKMLKALEAKPVKFTFPIANVSRKTMYEELPSELLALIKSCRKPHLLGGPCYECKTCKEYLEVGIKPL
jgi:hypothetical protein